VDAATHLEELLLEALVGLLKKSEETSPRHYIKAQP